MMVLERREIDRRELMMYVRKIDSSLEGFQKRIALYAVGGTALTLRDKKYMTKDIDFSVSRKDFIAISETVATIMRKEKTNIDIFVDGELAEYSLPEDYQEHSTRIISLIHIDLYVISNVDLVIMKGIAGRDSDIKDITGMAKRVQKQKIMQRFEQLRFKPGQKENLKQRLESSLGRLITK